MQIVVQRTLILHFCNPTFVVSTLIALVVQQVSDTESQCPIKYVYARTASVKQVYYHFVDCVHSALKLGGRSSKGGVPNGGMTFFW